MTQTLWKKIFSFVIVPFIVLLCALSIVIARLAAPGAAASPLLFRASAAVILAFTAFLVLMICAFRIMSLSISSLSIAARALSKGDLSVGIPASESRDEIGVITRSLHEMADQFRSHIVQIERAEGLVGLYKQLSEAIYRNVSLKDAFDSMAHTICCHFRADRISLVYVKDSGAMLISRHETDRGFDPIIDGTPAVFMHHAQVLNMLSDRKYIYMNSHAVSRNEIGFAGDGAASICLIAFRVSGDLRGYFIMENERSGGTFVNDDSSLSFISETVSYILSMKEEYIRIGASQSEVLEDGSRNGAADAADDEGGQPIVAQIRRISGLNVKKGLSLSGGSMKTYIELLRLSWRVFGDAIDKMRNFIGQDTRSFTIEIHGTKSALFNIGADDLGNLAKEIETTAKTGMTDCCAELYSDFERKLNSFRDELGTILIEKKDEPREAGDADVLLGELLKARTACEKYDTAGALEIIVPLSRLEYAGGQWCSEIEKRLARIIYLLENIEYDEARAKITAIIGEMEGGGQ
jgi:HAMP domain-containing protein/HPt (histidine-containing phosphotransfer) domain-containing protein